MSRSEKQQLEAEAERSLTPDEERIKLARRWIRQARGEPEQQRSLFEAENEHA